MRPWRSWIARQTPTLKAAGSNPVGRTKNRRKCIAFGGFCIIEVSCFAVGRWHLYSPRFEQIVVTVHVRWGHLMPESLALQGFLVFLFFGVISSEICKLGKIEVQNA